MDLLLLFILGIVISEYTEKKSRIINIVNSVVFIIFGLLIFYGSENSFIMYAAQNTLNSSFYVALHGALRYPIVIFGIEISSYFLILVSLIIISVIVGTLITVKIVQSFINIKTEQKAENLDEKQSHISIKNNEIKLNKLYLIFGGFLS